MPPTLDVERIDTPSVRRGMNPVHRVRPLIGPADAAAADPFLGLMEDWYGEGVFADHPHCGIETVSFVLEGGIEHYDNHGQQARLGPGDALWLTAGKGIVHNERPLQGETVHMLQLWVNLPRAAKRVPAALQVLHGAEMPTWRGPGVEARVFSGACGNARATTHNHAEVLLLDLRLQPHATFAPEVPAGLHGLLVPLDGDGWVGPGPSALSAGQVAWLTHHEQQAASVPLQAGPRGLRTLLLAGRPLREPVVARGPFVMNTEAEIQQAFADFAEQRERFGH